jgi:hypothetical protein
VNARSGEVQLRFLAHSHFANRHGTIQGGMLATMLDSATRKWQRSPTGPTCETTFLLRPTNHVADYRVRIFTPQRELPFAGHPTLGTCYVWLASGANPKADEIVQQCEIGLVHNIPDEGADQSDLGSAGPYRSFSRSSSSSLLP